VVPDLIGLTRELATGLVRQAGFRPRVHLEETADVPDGQVLSQKPGPGAPLDLQGTIDVIVARAPVARGVPVPDVVGKPRDEAERLLRAEGFLVAAVYSGGGDSEVGLVVDQDPAGGAFAQRRTWVGIAVVSGPGPRVAARSGPPAPLPVGDGAPSVPSGSGALTGPPAVGPGASRQPPPTPSGAQPRPPVRLPPRDAPASLRVPEVKGLPVRQAIERVLVAGLVPIIEMDRASGAAPGSVARQSPQAAAGARPGDLVRLGVAADVQDDRYVNLPPALGGQMETERASLAAKGLQVDVVEIASPGHPYAGTGLVAAQFPISAVPRRMGQRVTLWVVR
jgi:beta-lactam-binding protein with PASTA domain